MHSEASRFLHYEVSPRLYLLAYDFLCATRLAPGSAVLTVAQHRHSVERHSEPTMAFEAMHVPTRRCWGFYLLQALPSRDRVRSLDPEHSLA